MNEYKIIFTLGKEQEKQCSIVSAYGAQSALVEFFKMANSQYKKSININDISIVEGESIGRLIGHIQQIKRDIELMPASIKSIEKELFNQSILVKQISQTNGASIKRHFIDFMEGLDQQFNGIKQIFLDIKEDVNAKLKEKAKATAKKPTPVRKKRATV